MCISRNDRSQSVVGAAVTGCLMVLQERMWLLEGTKVGSKVQGTVCMYLYLLLR
jgi:hypothetical protein